MPDINLSQKTNLLEQDPYSYELQDVKKPALFHEMFPYNETPKIAFNYRRVPQNMPDDIFITDTTFRDGQQSRTPYTTEQMIHLYKLLHKLGGDNGMIRQTDGFQDVHGLLGTFPFSPAVSGRLKHQVGK